MIIIIALFITFGDKNYVNITVKKQRKIQNTTYMMIKIKSVLPYISWCTGIGFRFQLAIFSERTGIRQKKNLELPCVILFRLIRP